jgi:PhzF family phenazine biosynthesis protein
MAFRRFQQIDVFGSSACTGNPLAVVVDGDGLDDLQMQSFAAWTNLSETTFLLAPTRAEADYRVRIFTTTTELPFAGHPTLGSCHAWLGAGGRPRKDGELVQECGAGLVRVRPGEGRLAFAAPPLTRSGELEEALLDRVVRGLGVGRDEVVGHQWLVNGPGWMGVLLRDAERVLSLRPDAAALRGLDIGVVGPYAAGGPVAFEVRGFPYSDGPIEDPVTGSLNAGIAQWLIGNGTAPGNYVASQGTAMGRAGRVFVASEAGEIWIGGECRTVIEGHVTI